MLADDSGPPQVVMMVNQVIPQGTVSRADQLQDGFSIRVQGAFQKVLAKEGNLRKTFSSAIIVWAQMRGHLEGPLFLQTQ